MKTEMGHMLVEQVMTMSIGEEISIDADFINEVQSTLCSRALGGRRFVAEEAPDGFGYVLRRIAEEQVAVDVEEV